MRAPSEMEGLLKTEEIIFIRNNNHKKLAFTSVNLQKISSKSIDLK
jgi:hypothetical protein